MAGDPLIFHIIFLQLKNKKPLGRGGFLKLTVRQSEGVINRKNQPLLQGGNSRNHKLKSWLSYSLP